MSNLNPSSEAAWRIGLRGARANLRAGIILQLIATGIALGYYFYQPVRAALDQLSSFRLHTGFTYSSVATAVFGGVLPCLYLWFQPATRNRYRLAQCAALTLFWAYKGIEVDLWYRFLAHIVGTQVTVGTVLIKMVSDQFGYSLFWAVPSVTLFYELVDTDFDFRAAWTDWRAPRWYWRRALPNLISNLGIWIPAVCVIYSLPSSLQIPLFNLVLCFYTLIVAHITAQQARRTPSLEKIGRPPTVPIG